jgi:hypothetical protein
MTIELETKKLTISELPDITDEISEAIEKCEKSLNETYGYCDEAMLFVDAWLQTQKNKARISLAHKESKTSF